VHLESTWAEWYLFNLNLTKGDNIMGQINNKKLLAWFGTTTASCSATEIKDLSGIDITYRLGQGGIENSNPQSAEFGLKHTTFQCGTANLIYSNTTEYSVDGAITTDLDTSAGVMSLFFPEQFVLEGGDGAGTYILTTTFMNNKPTYKNGAWWSWFDGISWVVSTPTRSKDGTFFLNNSDTPNVGPYGSLVMEGSIPVGALHTEDLASILAVEDVTAIITTEA
jgi:hypothetical protein